MCTGICLAFVLLELSLLRYTAGCVSAGSGNIASGQQSDHLLMAAAYNGWQAAKQKVRRQSFQIMAGALTA